MAVTGTLRSKGCRLTRDKWRGNARDGEVTEHNYAAHRCRGDALGEQGMSTIRGALVALSEICVKSRRWLVDVPGGMPYLHGHICEDIFVKP
jgi:hypothetical protein